MNTPSPRLASVIGQRPATAPLPASVRSRSRSCAWRGSATSARRPPRDRAAIDRPRARPGEAILDLLDLLGDDGCGSARPPASATTSASSSGVTARRRMRRDADLRVPPGNPRRGGRSRRGPLRKRRCPAAAARRRNRVGVEHRQQRQADAGRRRRRRRCARPSRRVARRGGRRRVVQIVKLRRPGESRLQHLDIGLAAIASTSSGVSVSAKRYIISRQVQKLSCDGAARLGQPGHAALEGVAVEIGEAGKAERMPLVAALGARRRSRRRRSRRRRSSGARRRASPSGVSARREMQARSCRSSRHA